MKEVLLHSNFYYLLESQNLYYTNSDLIEDGYIVFQFPTGSRSSTPNETRMYVGIEVFVDIESAFNFAN